MARGALPLLAALLLAPAGAAQVPDPADPARAPTIREALIRLARRFDPSAETGPIRAQLDVYALELRARLETLEGAPAKARAVGSYFFGTPLLSAAQDLGDPDNFYVHRVFAGRQGFCLALSAIVLATGEKLGLPLHAVATPRHIFVRWDDGTTRLNLETTEGGQERPDSWYRARGIPADAEKEGLWLRNLSKVELIAHLLNNEGYILWRKGQLEQAERRFQEALALHPAFVEGWLNLGVVAGERGDAESASAHFGRVLRWIPKDAPTLFNRSLAALRAGRFEEALADMESAAAQDPASAHLLHYRDVVLATVLRPENWTRHQADLAATGRTLRAEGRLAPGLRGSYFPNRELRGPPRTRIDRDLRFEWRYGEPMAGIPADDFSVRWEGFVEIPSEGVWTFLTVANDGVRVWVDGVRILDDWKRNEGALGQESLSLVAGLHPLRIEYFEAERFAGISFQVKRADREGALPASAFCHRR